MLHGLFIAALISTCVNKIKRVFEPTITAEQRANKKLLDQDIIKGVPYKQIKKNIKNGKYRLTETQVEQHSKPHRNLVSGKIIIENNLLYKEDLEKYGAYQTHQWAKQGKYNLTSAELKKEEERIKKYLENLYGL